MLFSWFPQKFQRSYQNPKINEHCLSGDPGPESSHQPPSPLVRRCVVKILTSQTWLRPPEHPACFRLICDLLSSFCISDVPSETTSPVGRFRAFRAPPVTCPWWQPLPAPVVRPLLGYMCWLLTSGLAGPSGPGVRWCLRHPLNVGCLSFERGPPFPLLLLRDTSKEARRQLWTGARVGRARMRQGEGSRAQEGP